METRYKESMVSNAQLYNEKATLVYQVETLKDRYRDVTEAPLGVQRREYLYHTA